jgi:hypothetical protein
VAAVSFLTAGAVIGSLQSLYLGVLALVLLWVSVAPFLLPTHYVVSDLGVEERRGWRRRFRPWTGLRRVDIGRDAALLSPLARPSWLDRYRGLVLLFDGADRDLVVKLIAQKLPGPRGGGGPG